MCPAKIHPAKIQKRSQKDAHHSEKYRGRSYWTTERYGEVRLRRQKDSLNDEAPLTVHDMVMGTALRYANYIALGSKHKDGWHLLTYVEYYEECRRAAKAFLKLGLKRFHGVGIMGLNSEEWVIASIGAIMAGKPSPHFLRLPGIESPSPTQNIGPRPGMSPSRTFTQGMLWVWGCQGCSGTWRLPEVHPAGSCLLDSVSRGFSVGILSSSSAKACQVIAENTEMDFFVVDDNRQLQKVLQIQGSLKHLQAIVQYKEDLQVKQENLYSWKGFLNLAKAVPDDTLDKVVDSQRPNQCCTVVYSLASTGPSKAVMLSHDNITWTTAATIQSLCYKCPPEGQEVLVNYLPLSYIGAQIFDMWVAISVAGALYFAQPDALKGSLMDTLREVRPTTFCGVPWMWDRMYDAMKTRQLDSSGFWRMIDKWAMRLGLQTNRRRMSGHVHPPLCFRLAKKLTFDGAKKALGLDHCQQFFSMGLGLSRVTQEFFLGLDIPIFQLYGLTECTGVHTLSSYEAFQVLSCGKGLPDTHTKVPEEDENKIGEIYLWGRNIFMGYLNNKEGTEKKMDSHGWLHTGDLGFLDDSDFLYVMGNIKDTITLSSGQKIHPTPIEERVKLSIPIVRYAVVVGQDAPYLCALLTLKCQINSETGEPRDVLTSEAVAFCRKLRSQSTRLTDIILDRDPLVSDFISQSIEAINSEASSDGARIVKWTILDTDFSVGGGELGATMKLRRAAVTKIYQEEIESFYKDD